MHHKVAIKNLSVNRSYYRPGEEVKIHVVVETEKPLKDELFLVLDIYSLMSIVYRETQKLEPGKTQQTFEFSYVPFRETPRGYGVDLILETISGEPLAVESTAFDVLDNWTQNPRYGFLTDFSPTREDHHETLALLSHFHINGLQFYDWMYRHEQFLTEQDPYCDLWSSKPKSITTIQKLIEIAHQYSVAAMPYTAVYGCSRDFALQHPEMALYLEDGKMHEFGGDKMMIMDPRPESSWVAHLQAQFREVLDNTEFDGIHIDQYGEPKYGFDQEGHRFDLAGPMVDFVNKTKSLTDKYSPKNATVFNLVNNWPVEDIAPSNEDFMYIEVWEPHVRFADLHSLIVNAQKLSGGKPVVLACYIDPKFENTAILNDAIIFASGGGHIELGEKGGMLAEAYFPSYQIMSNKLLVTLRHYYDFCVRYQEVIGPNSVDATTLDRVMIDIPGVNSSTAFSENSIWQMIRKTPGHTAINLVNFLGIKQMEWAKNVQKPTPVKGFQLTVMTDPSKVSAVWFVTPDDPYTRKWLDFKKGTESITMTVPSLDYWSVVVIDWVK